MRKGVYIWGGQKGEDIYAYRVNGRVKDRGRSGTRARVGVMIEVGV